MISSSSHLPQALLGGGRIEPLRRDSGGGTSRCGLARFGNEPPPAVSAKRLACDLPQLSLVEVTCWYSGGRVRGALTFEAPFRKTLDYFMRKVILCKPVP